MTSRVPDYYSVLQVDQKASTSEIRKAYLKLCKQYHPDTLPDTVSDEARKLVSEKMIAINEAYEVLKDDEARQRYDTTFIGFQSQRSSQSQTSNSRYSSYQAEYIEDLFSPAVIAEGEQAIAARQEEIRKTIDLEFSKLEYKYHKALDRIKNHQPNNFEVTQSSSNLEKYIIVIAILFLTLFLVPYGPLTIAVLFFMIIIMVSVYNNFRATVYPAAYINAVKALAARQEKDLAEFKNACKRQVQYFKSIPIATIDYQFVSTLSPIDRVLLLQALKEREDTEQAAQFIRATVKTVAVVGLVAIFLGSLSH